MQRRNPGPVYNPSNPKLPPTDNVLQPLPKVVYCPVCGEKMIFTTMKPSDAQAALASGAKQAATLMCGCGVSGALTLRVTLEGLHLYTLSFWLAPKVQAEAGTLSSKEVGR